jgi:protein SCO1/2
MILRLRVLWASLAVVAVATAAPLPSDSIYQLAMPLTLQDGTHTTLAALRGQPTVITMFYASCDGVCPMIAFSMRRMEAKLTAKERERAQWVMVSFDPEHDTPEALREFAATNQLDLARWRLARPDDSSVRNLAAALGVRYRKLPNGAFSHSTEIVLLDANGVIKARTANLNQLDGEFMHAIQKELQ